VRRLDTRIAGPVLLQPTVHRDDRGFFLESYRASVLAEHGVDDVFVQDNHSRSVRDVLRGMHFQVGAGQAKLVRCVAGSILDVVVDLRRGSPTHGEWEAFELDADEMRMLYVPVGFAHGFLIRSAVADVLYKCSSYYDGAIERGIAWDDPDVGIDWPVAQPILSARDVDAPRLRDVADELPFAWRD
jgi:dTDP-4-dehydrorhamnose 3,5-epimerase